MDLPATQVYYEDEVGTLTIDHRIKNECRTTIGSHGSCNIVIEDATVAKTHAEIIAIGGSAWICDQKSSNETMLNNSELLPYRYYKLEDGSVLEFGKARAIYHTRCPADNKMIPKMSASPRQTIIPNTVDSSLELKTEKFDDVNNDRKSPHMSTQYLENVLESSQCDDTDQSFADDKDTSSVSRKRTCLNDNMESNKKRKTTSQILTKTEESSRRETKGASTSSIFKIQDIIKEEDIKKEEDYVELLYVCDQVCRRK